MDQTTPKVGKLLDGTEGRDAIHFALAPMIATEELQPAQAITLVEMGGNEARACIDPKRWGKGLGIVDPFLTDTVKKGERFWMFLYPGTITNLRHVWSHPAFVRPPLGVTKDAP